MTSLFPGSRLPRAQACRLRHLLHERKNRCWHSAWISPEAKGSQPPPSDTATGSRALWEAATPNPRAALNFSPRYTTRASGSHHKPRQHSSPTTCCHNTCRSQPPRDSTKLPRWAPPGRFKEEIQVQQLFLLLVWNQEGQKYQGFCTTCSRSVGLAAPASGIAVLLTRLWHRCLSCTRSSGHRASCIMCTTAIYFSTSSSSGRKSSASSLEILRLFLPRGWFYKGSFRERARPPSLKRFCCKKRWKETKLKFCTSHAPAEG